LLVRVIIDEPFVEKRAGATQRAMTIGIVLLFGAMFLSFNPRFVLLAYGVLLVALVVVNWAGHAAGKWLRKPRVDQTLARALKGLSNDYRLYSYLLPAEHVMLSPTGLFILKVKLLDGRISCHGERWHRQFSLGRLVRLLSEERLGNPSKQAQNETEMVRRFVTSHLPDMDVPMQPVVLFVDPKAELSVVEPTVPVVPLQDLKAYLRKSTGEKAMPRQMLKALTDLFDEQAT
jgi:hypothetical protein